MTISPGTLATAEDILAALNSNASVSNAAKAASDAATAAASAATAAASAAQTAATGATSVKPDGTTLSRTVAVRFGEQMSVGDFGAVGDNSTDDTTAIQAALTAASTLKRPLFVPAGMGLITKRLNVASSLYLHGAGCYSTPFTGWASPSMFRFAVDGTCLGTNDANLNTVTIEKMGFLGDYLAYPNQIGVNLDDSIRAQFQTCEITFRDVLCKWFNTGIHIGNKYQTCNIWNTACISCSNIGVHILTSDCYVFNLACGNSGEGTHTQLAATAQLLVGDFTPPAGASGYNTFIGGQFFGGKRAVVLVSSYANSFVGSDIQIATDDTLLIGDGVNGCANNAFHRCKFSGGNIAGGSGNVNGTFFSDVTIQNGAYNNSFVGCLFADNAGQTQRTAAAINISNPSNAKGALGTLVSDCSFNMDNITTPGGTDYAVLTQPGTDYTTIRFANCQKLSGMAGRLPFGTTFTVVDNNSHTLCT